MSIFVGLRDSCRQRLEKSFLRALSGSELVDIGPATPAAELHAAGQGADFIRTHDIASSPHRRNTPEGGLRFGRTQP